MRVLVTVCLIGLAGAGLAGCATRAAQVRAAPADPAEFLAWDCGHIEDELDRVLERATDVAYSVDERAGNNIIALGVGVTLFWPALVAMRTEGPEAAELARLKGRDEALRKAAQLQGCPPPSDTLSAARAARLPLSAGDRLVYEDRSTARDPASEWVLRLTALHRNDIEYRIEVPAGGSLWRQDHAGNIVAGPAGALQWPHLLRSEMALGAVTAGDIVVGGDPLTRARLRGQVVAVGPQTVAGRRFDVAVVELFGDAQRGETTTRIDGAIVVDRVHGVLLRLDLRCALAPFSLQRRLVRVESPAPG